ncbi:MAG: DUF4186 domain-containing protein [Candidatus Omnitrophica bacterium]|nr:DUF4186 domain-containing protein [Candidatus Omnitrophota bacterium]
MLTPYRNSKFRARFRLDGKDIACIQRYSIEKIESHARDFIVRKLAPARPYNDGKQTPFKGHPVFKAQHATATCCRGCLEKWYNIPKGRPLTEAEIDMAVSKIMEWINLSCEKEMGRSVSAARE